MFDLITYTKDSVAFLAEVVAKFPDKVVFDEQDPTLALSVLITKTPTIRNGNETLAVVRCDAQELADIKTLTTVVILSEVALGGDLLAAMTTANRAIYDSVHSQAPVTYTDQDGVQHTYTPPALIGAFA